MKRKAVAAWSGTGLEGTGSLTTQSGTLNNTPLTFKTRFTSEDGRAGTNPEELIAAAHAGCFTMQLSFFIVEAGHTADLLTTEATVEVGPKEGGGFIMSNIHLDLTGKVTGMSAEKFYELAEKAKSECIISHALRSVPMTLHSHFEA